MSPIQCSMMSSARPKQKTTTGIRKWMSVRIAFAFVGVVMQFLSDHLRFRAVRLVLESLSELMSITKRYFTSCFNMRS